jgi:hypothetical protein
MNPTEVELTNFIKKVGKSKPPLTVNQAFVGGETVSIVTGTQCLSKFLWSRYLLNRITKPDYL